MNPTIYSTKDLADMFDVTPQTIRNEIQRGKLKCFYAGREPRFTKIHLEEYMNVRAFGKTTREIELEKKIDDLKVIIQDKDKLVNNIKELLLKGGI